MQSSSYDPLVSGPDILCSGDSLTVGPGVTNAGSYPMALQTLIGSRGVVRNYGVGSETSSTIAGRIGAGPMLATIEGGRIPESGGVTVGLVGYDNDVVSPLRQQGAPGINPCRIANIGGTLSFNGEAYVFTRNEAGAAVNVPFAAAVVTDLYLKRRGDIHIMEWGVNDMIDDATMIIQRQKHVIEALDRPVKRWLVLGFTVREAAWRQKSNAQFLAAFGRRFVDIGTYLSSPAALARAGLTPTSEETRQMSMGIVPDSLRIDWVHLNDTGYRLKAQAIYERMLELCWLAPDAS